MAHDAIAGAPEVLNRLRGAFMLATKSNSKTIFYSRSAVVVEEPARAGTLSKPADLKAGARFHRKLVGVTPNGLRRQTQRDRFS